MLNAHNFSDTFGMLISTSALCNQIGKPLSLTSSDNLELASSSQKW